MQTNWPHDRFATALFRLLAARRGPAAAGVFALEPSGCRPLAATEALGELRRDAMRGPWILPDGALASAPRQIDPARLGLTAAFAAVVAIPGPAADLVGVLLVADRAPRRLTPALAELLSDTATLAAPILTEAATERHRAPATPAGREVLRRAVRPRAAAEQMIKSALAGDIGGRRSGLILIDLDRFRAVNEALGVAAGDALLAVTGTRLERSLSAGDRLVRMEGDRFVIVAHRPAGELRTLARQLLRTISQPIAIGGRSLVMRASIGMSASVAGSPRPVLLLLQAETALRRAKQGGHNRLVLHEPTLDGVALDESRLELDLSNAAANGEMRLDFQPYIDLADGHISGAEALIRWRHPTRGELRPASFIPLAEATGLILPLGRWALREALAKALTWPPDVALSVNISPIQFHQAGFLAEIDDALAVSGFPPERLELEITETVLMRDDAETTATLHALMARGVRIALDDFGTGYSALAYLARLPHHRIKLDKAFIRDLTNPGTAALIGAIIALAHAQGVAVTAEGVEHPEDLALVRRAGFTHAQGYATGLPTPDPAGLLRHSASACAG